MNWNFSPLNDRYQWCQFQKSLRGWVENFNFLSYFYLELSKFFMSFFKLQVSFSLNFTSLFSVMKDNSYVLFKLKHYILWLQEAHQNTNFLDFRVLKSKFLKFFVNFKTTGHFCKFLYHSLLLWHKTPL